MAFIPATNVLMLEIRGTLHGLPYENTLYFDRGENIPNDDVEALFDYFEDDWLPAFLGQAGSALIIGELYATDQTSATSPAYTRIISPPLQGAGTSTPTMPGNVAFVISFRTNGRGRSSRGRNYVGGQNEANVTANVVQQSYADALVGIYGDLLGVGGFPPEWTWVVVSRFSNKAPRVVALAQPIIDVLYTDLTVDTQRGRLK